LWHVVGLAVFMFAFAVVMAGLGCADQRSLYWNFTAWTFRDPAANEPSDAAFAVRRVSLFVVAAGGVGMGIWMLVLHAQATFDEGDVRAAVKKAAVSLSKRSVLQQDDVDMSYDTYVDGALVDAAPAGLILHAEAVGEAGDLPAGFTIRATDTKGVFCLTVSDGGPAKGGDIVVPGAPGGKVTAIKERKLAAKVTEGACTAD
jgi:hypothetical protein